MTDSLPSQVNPPPAGGPPSQRVRVRYAKRDDLRLLSHRDMLRLLERLFRRAELNLAMSQGFHPKPKMSFPLALGLGIDGLNEVMELELASVYALDELLQRMNEQAPDGLEFLSVETPPSRVRGGHAKGQVSKTKYAIRLPESQVAATELAVERFVGADEWLVQRAKKQKKRRGRRKEETKTVDLRSGVENLWIDDGHLHMTILEVREAGVRPRDVLEAVGLADIEKEGAVLVRTDVMLSDESHDSQEGDSV